jgi:hypothetical protein
VTDLLINLAASVVAGTAVWLAQRLLRLRRLARKRAFFGITAGSECLLSVAKHHDSPHRLSVHRRDVAALVEIATIVRDCGGRSELVSENDVPPGIGRLTEFCVGGPVSNPRTAAHLAAILRGVRIEPDADGSFLLSIGDTAFRRGSNNEEYVVLARAWGPAGGQPVFILSGPTARTNLAAAGFLARNDRELHRRYGATKRFCLVLRVVDGASYGSDFTEIATDATGSAFEPAAVPTVEPTEA